jgi:Uncharacterised nucleotidyltransferase
VAFVMMNGVTQLIALTPEQRLIGKVLSADWTAGVRREWDPALFCDLDCRKLFNLSWQHKVRPMVATALREARWPGVPADVQAAMQLAEKKCSQKSLLQLSLLTRLISAAEERGIRVIALKGVALSLYLYGDPFIREAFDLDFLVHAKDTQRFEDLLMAHGCEQMLHDPPLTPRQTAFLQRFHHDKKFTHAESGLVIESHFELVRNRYLIGTDFDALWEARTMVPLGNVRVAIPGEDDLLYYLGIHAARHDWERWKWIADLVKLYRGTSAEEMSRQRERAVRDGNQDLFDSWILIVSAVTGAAFLPEQLGNAAGNARAVALMKNALRFSSREYTPGKFLESSSSFGRSVQRLKMKRSPRYLGYELLSLFHRDDDWYALNLPDHLMWAYYLFRPISIVQRLGQFMFRSGEKKSAL